MQSHSKWFLFPPLHKVYLIEVAHGKGKKQKGTPLADFAFRRFADLGLAKQVTRIDEGAVEMTPSQHKGRNLMFITMSQSHEFHMFASKC